MEDQEQEQEERLLLMVEMKETEQDFQILLFVKKILKLSNII